MKPIISFIALLTLCFTSTLHLETASAELGNSSRKSKSCRYGAYTIGRARGKCRSLAGWCKLRSNKNKRTCKRTVGRKKSNKKKNAFSGGGGNSNPNVRSCRKYGKYTSNGRCRTLAGWCKLRANKNKSKCKGTRTAGISKTTNSSKSIKTPKGASKYLSCYKRSARRRFKGKRSKYYCYRGVKKIALDCGATKSYMGGRLAKNAGGNLRAHGFRRLKTKNPNAAPPGAIIVYGNTCKSTHYAGHIEIKLSQNSYVSDYFANAPRSSKTKCRPVTSIWFK